MRTANIFIITAVLTLLVSCASGYKLDVKEVVDLDNYDVYTFRLCERIKTVGKDRFLLCDDACQESDVQSNDKIQVVEELYLLLSNVNKEDAIYITSRSDKYIHEDRGAFNDDAYKKYIFTHDLERFYFGKIDANRKITFVNLQDTLVFKLNENKTNNCTLAIDSIQSISRERITFSNKELKLSNLFSVDFQLNKSNRVFANRPKKRDTIFETIETIDLRGRRIFFTGSNSEESLSQRRWLKYHPDFKLRVKK